MPAWPSSLRSKPSKKLVGRDVRHQRQGPYFLIQALLPLLNPGAAIVLNGSINAHIGMPNLERIRGQQGRADLAGEIAVVGAVGQGMRVNVVSPGPSPRLCTAALACLQTALRSRDAVSRPRSRSSASGRPRGRERCAVSGIARVGVHRRHRADDRRRHESAVVFPDDVSHPCSIEPSSSTFIDLPAEGRCSSD